MNESLSERQTRRRFFAGTLRKASLALLAVGSGAAVMKRRRLLREGKCLSRGVCRDCAAFEGCGLPRARSVRHAVARSHDGQ